MDDTLRKEAISFDNDFRGNILKFPSPFETKVFYYSIVRAIKRSCKDILRAINIKRDISARSKCQLRDIVISNFLETNISLPIAQHYQERHKQNTEHTLKSKNKENRNTYQKHTTPQKF